MKLQFMIFVMLILLITSCNTSKKLTKIEPTFQEKIAHIILEDSTFSTSHTGLLVKEVGTGEVIFDHKSDQYFTPASNTKLLTFYTALNVLGDYVHGLKVYENADSVIIWGTGDASFLNGNLQINDFISEKLKSTSKPLYLSTSNFQDVHYGSGWSWDDYNYGYQADKHSLPMYGNMVHFTKPEPESKFEVIPVYFRKLTVPNEAGQKATVMRMEDSNVFNYDYNKVKTTYKIDRYVPYLTSNTLQQTLLQEHLGKPVELINSQTHIGVAQKLTTVHVDSLYALLLQPSDNFVAEQLLLNCGSELFDTLNTAKVIDWSKENLLIDLPHEFQWYDGSGLSRYNMITPGNMVYLLTLIHQKIDQDRLFRLLPTGGESGTIKNLYADEKPFVHAKTGTLKNNHALSGFLVGDSGKVYVFSFMNSNFLVSNKELKEGMDNILRILKANL
jgi:D-alanyl-D-alanine carboxypeptidase/D-alanyl-D-alanine-endopeptidase (penicillin-binding protein 4)